MTRLQWCAFSVCAALTAVVCQAKLSSASVGIFPASACIALNPDANDVAYIAGGGVKNESGSGITFACPLDHDGGTYTDLDISVCDNHTSNIVTGQACSYNANGSSCGDVAATSSQTCVDLDVDHTELNSTEIYEELYIYVPGLDGSSYSRIVGYNYTQS